MTMPVEGTTVSAVESTVNTPDGIIVGVDPAQPRPAVQSPTLPPAPPAPDARFTADDIQKAREQEKSKVYSRIETLQAQVSELAAEREARLTAEAEQQRIAAEAERIRLESETDIRDLLKQKEQDWESKFQALQAEAERERVLREKEAEFNEFQAFKAQQIAAASEDILPELIDFVAGNNPEEIAASIAGLRERSAQIMNNTAEALAAARREQPGVRPTGLSLAGPLDNETANQTMTPAEIASLSMSEYAANRGRLGVTRSTSGRGLFS